MDINEQIKATGTVTMDIIRDGKIIETKQFKNLVVTVGKEFIASRMVGTSKAVMSHMAIGSSSTPANAADNSTTNFLSGGSQLARQALASSTASGSTITYSATFLPTVGTGAVVEAGLLNAATGGDLLCRTVFSVVNKGAADTIAVTWQVTIG